MQCRTCLTNKKKSEFYSDSKNKQGVRSVCKSCDNNLRQARRAEVLKQKLERRKNGTITLEEKGVAPTSLNELLTACSIDEKDWSIDAFNIQSQDTKNGPAFTVKATLSPKEADNLQPVRVAIPSYKSKPRSSSDLLRALIIPDSQNGYLRQEDGTLIPFHDRRCWSLAFQIAEYWQPDTIVFLGDQLDLPEMSEKFLKTPEMYFTFQPAIIELAKTIGNLRTICPEADMIYCEGNHECFDEETEFLTDDGWMLFNDLTPQTKVASFNIANNNIEFSEPIALHSYDYNGQMYKILGTNTDLMITPNHRLLSVTGSARNKKWTMQEVQNLPTNSTRRTFYASGKNNHNDYPIQDIEIQLVAWAFTDGHVSYGKQGGTTKIEFYQRDEKKQRIIDILDAYKLNYLVKKRDRNITEICGKPLKKKPSIGYEFSLYADARRLIEQFLPRPERLLEFIVNLSERQFSIFLNECIYTDGSRHKSAPETSMMIYGDKWLLDIIQVGCVINGFRTSLVEYRSTHWRLNITKNQYLTLDRFNNHCIREQYNGKVNCLTTNNDTCIVRRHGKISITGNSRLNKYLYNNALPLAKIRRYNEELPVMSIPYLLGLDDLNVRWIDYPQEYWLNDNLKISHGTVVRNGSGETVGRLANDLRSSEIQGHIHRVELASKTVWRKDGPITYIAASPGCFADLEGPTPCKYPKNNWQNGFATVLYDEEKYAINLHHIFNGKTIFDGQVFEGDPNEEVFRID